MCSFFSIDFILKAYEHVELPKEDSEVFHPEFVKAVIFWAVLYIVLHLVFNPVFYFLFPKTWKSLPPNKQKELSTYILSTSHHFVVVPIVFYSVVSDLYAYSLTHEPFEPSHLNHIYAHTGVVAFSVGFFFGDGIAYYIPEALAGRPMYLFHHVLSVIIITSTRSFSGVVLQALPQLLSIELSTAFFNVAWLCRCLLGDKAPAALTSFLELSFAVTFFLLRIINGTLMIVLIRSEVWEASKLFFVAYVMALLLQYFWFYKIVMSIAGGSRKKKKLS